MVIDTWFGEPASLGFLHLPDGGARAGVVICAPMGYDLIVGYRGIRLLSQELESRGVASLRFDYRGEGDSAGPTALADAPDGWLQTIADGVAFMREAGVERVVLLGLGVGALLAEKAARRIPELDALVLWDPVVSGRRHLRRQRSLFEMTISAPETVADTVTLLSLTLHEQAAAWLQEQEITAQGLTDGDLDTLVLVRRSDLDVPAIARLVDRADPAAGGRVQCVPIDGQREWIEAPAALVAMPTDGISQIAAWLDDRLPAARSVVVPRVTAVARVGTAPDGVPIVERVQRFGPERLLVIETTRSDATPDDGAGVVLFQPGAADHRVGTGRFQTGAARELAARGHRAIRFDRRRTGESTPVRAGERSLVFAEEWIHDLDALTTAFGAGRPVAHIGLCSGAWVAARLAERRPAQLTVMMSSDYFKVRPLQPGDYDDLVRQTTDDRIRFVRLRTRLRGLMPGWVWRLTARLEWFHDPERLLSLAMRGNSGTLVMMFTPADTRNFVVHRGRQAVERIRRSGTDLRVVDYPFGDHALFGGDIRAALLRDILELADGALTPAAARRSPTSVGV